MHVCGFVGVNAGTLHAGTHEGKFPSRPEASGLLELELRAEFWFFSREDLS